MRTLAFLLALVGFVAPAFGAKRVTVDELEQSVAAARSLPDGEAAKQLSNLELSERLNTANFGRLETTLPGEKSREALMILADASAFLDPPAAEIPNRPAPDLASQRKILAMTVNYVTQTLQRLPNFFATRVTRSFEDKPGVEKSDPFTTHGVVTATAYQAIHPVGNLNVTVSFRDGHEVVEKGKSDPLVRNLTTSGVFGPILSTVLVDAARSKLAWSHWEVGQTGLQAVFSYEVPKENSHYTLTYDSIPTNADPCGTATPQTYSKVVAYRGEMAIDPESGTILRLTLLADMKPVEQTVKSGIEVEYGRVSIGGKDYFLPVRSMTSSLAHTLLTVGASGPCPSLALSSGLQTSLNDVVFKDYHVFRSDATVLTDSEAVKVESQPSRASSSGGPKETEETSSASPSTTAPANTSPAGGSNAAHSESTVASPANFAAPESRPATSAEGQPVATLPSAVAQPSTATDSNAETSASDAPANSNPKVSSSSVFRTTARQVLVDVVVDKKNGDPVPGLVKSDFSIEENGKPQTIDFFEEHSAGASAPLAPAAMPPLAPGTVNNVPTAARSAALYVFLLDSLNTGPQDQVYMRQQILAFLHKLDPGTEVAVFSLGSQLHLLQGFTSDPAALLAAVSGEEAEREAMAQTRSDNADDAEHTAHLTAMRSAAPQVAQYSRGSSPQGYSFGARTSMTFEALSALARYLEGIPGRKNLIWFSTSFPVVFFPTPAEMDRLKNNPNLPGYANHVKETANLFTLSKIAVYPVGVAGVMSSNIGMADSPDAGSAGGTGHFGTAAGPTGSLTSEALNSASTLSGMEQLAASTGGRAFATNEIDAALRRIMHDSDVYYTVGYAPTDSAPDDAFRRIDIKVAGGKFKLTYRQGYNASSVSTDAASPEDPIAPLLQLGLPNATGILYGATVGPGGDHDSDFAGQNTQIQNKGPLTRYTVSFTIRGEDIAFDQTPNGKRIAKFLIGVKAYDKNGSALNWQANRSVVEPSQDQYDSILKNGLTATVGLDLPANTSAQIVTAVYDWNSQRAGTLEVSIHP